MKSQGTVIIGIRSHVVSIDSATGEEIWRTKLKSGQFVTVYSRDDRVFAGVWGELFGLDRTTGRVLWHSQLRRLGFGLISFAADPGKRTPHDVIIGIKGHIVSIDATTGHELWRTNLPSRMGSEAVTLAANGSQMIVAGTSGELFGVERGMGKVLWKAPLKGLGVGLITLGSSELAIATAMAQAQAAAAAAAAS